MAAIAGGLLVAPRAVEAQQARVYRVGVISHGGSIDQAFIEGLRDGLKELGFEEGAQYHLDIRDAKGNLAAVGVAAKGLEADKVDLIRAFSTSTSVGAKQATKSIPIVFHVGTDPIEVGLVESFRKPGGRLTGVNSQVTDLTAKRLELLKQMVPRLRRVVAFYSPDNPAALESMKKAREGARRLNVVLVERPVGSVEELRAGLLALKPGEVDGVLHISDAMITRHLNLVIEATRVKKLPLIVPESEGAAREALASYGVSNYAGGRLMAKYVHRILLGAKPADLPIEQIDRLHLVINLKTAKALGLTVPPSVLARADEVIQ